MREDRWTAEGRDQLSAAVEATLGATRLTVGAEMRAIGRALEPTERVLAVTVCSFEIVRHEAVACRSIGAFAVVTDRRLLFARKVPFRPARIDEVARTEWRDAETEVDASDRHLAVVARDLRVTMRNMLGQDAVEAMVLGIGATASVMPDDDPDTALPEPEPFTPLGPGSHVMLVPHPARGAYCLEQDDRVVALLMRSPDGTAFASLAGRALRLERRSEHRGWIGVAEDERTGERVASYRPAFGSGGTLTQEGRDHRLKRGLSGVWRLKTDGTEVAVMHGGDPRGDIQMAAGVADVADPVLLVVMIVWGRWLEVLTSLDAG